MNKILIVFLLIVIVGLGGYFVGTKKSNSTNSITPTVPAANIKSFEDCVNAGYPVMESYPRQCRAGDKHFTEDIGNANEKADLIIVESPRPNEKITSPLTVNGQARGNWYFEASFPIYLYDADGKELGVTVAQAEGEWMTTEFVPISTTLKFSKPDTSTGELVLKKDNPSGLTENDDELRIQIKF